MEELKIDGRSKAAREAKQADTIETPEVKRGTRPGWKPSSVLPQLKARSGFTARWMSNEPARIAAKMSEGWVIMKPSDNVGTPIRQLDNPDTNSLGSEVRYRDMVAMMLPDDVKRDRDDYHRDEREQAIRQVHKKSDEQFKQSGVQTYTPKGQAGRIVIE
jgi:hypothetical protein